MGLSESVDAAMERLLNLLNEETGGSLPKSIAERELVKEFPQQLVKTAIQYAVDRFLVNLVVDYPVRKWGVHRTTPVWHIKLLTPEEARRIKGLKPAVLALIRLLQQQDDPMHVGEMRERDVRASLAQKGFSEQHLRSLWVDDMVDSLFMYEGDESIEWVRLIPEEEKTEEYKREEERIAMLAIDRESREIREHEEYEKEQMRKQKRKPRAGKKTSHSQST